MRQRTIDDFLGCWKKTGKDIGLSTLTNVKTDAMGSNTSSQIGNVEELDIMGNESPRLIPQPFSQYDSSPVKGRDKKLMLSPSLWGGVSFDHKQATLPNCSAESQTNCFRKKSGSVESILKDSFVHRKTPELSSSSSRNESLQSSLIDVTGVDLEPDDYPPNQLQGHHEEWRFSSQEDTEINVVDVDDSSRYIQEKKELKENLSITNVLSKTFDNAVIVSQDLFASTQDQSSADSSDGAATKINVTENYCVTKKDEEDNTALNKLAGYENEQILPTWKEIKTNMDSDDCSNESQGTLNQIDERLCTSKFPDSECQLSTSENHSAVTSSTDQHGLLSDDVTMRGRSYSHDVTGADSDVSTSSMISLSEKAVEGESSLLLHGHHEKLQFSTLEAFESNALDSSSQQNGQENDKEREEISALNKASDTSEPLSCRRVQTSLMSPRKSAMKTFDQFSQLKNKALEAQQDNLNRNKFRGWHEDLKFAARQKTRICVVGADYQESSNEEIQKEEEASLSEFRINNSHSVIKENSVSADESFKENSGSVSKCSVEDSSSVDKCRKKYSVMNTELQGESSSSNAEFREENSTSEIGSKEEVIVTIAERREETYDSVPKNFKYEMDLDHGIDKITTLSRHSPKKSVPGTNPLPTTYVKHVSPTLSGNNPPKKKLANHRATISSKEVEDIVNYFLLKEKEEEEESKHQENEGKIDTVMGITGKLCTENTCIKKENALKSKKTKLLKKRKRDLLEQVKKEIFWDSSWKSRKGQIVKQKEGPKVRLKLKPPKGNGSVVKGPHVVKSSSSFLNDEASDYHVNMTAHFNASNSSKDRNERKKMAKIDSVTKSTFENSEKVVGSIDPEETEIVVLKTEVVIVENNLVCQSSDVASSSTGKRGDCYCQNDVMGNPPKQNTYDELQDSSEKNELYDNVGTNQDNSYEEQVNSTVDVIQQNWKGKKSASWMDFSLESSVNKQGSSEHELYGSRETKKHKDEEVQKERTFVKNLVDKQENTNDELVHVKRRSKRGVDKVEEIPHEQLMMMTGVTSQENCIELDCETKVDFNNRLKRKRKHGSALMNPRDDKGSVDGKDKIKKHKHISDSCEAQRNSSDGEYHPKKKRRKHVVEETTVKSLNVAVVSKGKRHPKKYEDLECDPNQEAFAVQVGYPGDVQLKGEKKKHSQEAPIKKDRSQRSPQGDQMSSVGVEHEQERRYRNTSKDNESPENPFLEKSAIEDGREVQKRRKKKKRKKLQDETIGDIPESGQINQETVTVANLEGQRKTNNNSIHQNKVIENILLKDLDEKQRVAKGDRNIIKIVNNYEKHGYEGIMVMEEDKPKDGFAQQQVVAGDDRAEQKKKRKQRKKLKKLCQDDGMQDLTQGIPTCESLDVADGQKARKKKKKHQDEVIEDTSKKILFEPQIVTTVDEKVCEKKKEQQDELMGDMSEEYLYVQKNNSEDYPELPVIERRNKRHQEVVIQEDLPQTLEVYEREVHFIPGSDIEGQKKKKKKKRNRKHDQDEVMDKDLPQETFVAPKIVIEDDRDGRKKKKKKRQHEIMEKDVSQEDLVVLEIVNVNDGEGQKKRKKLIKQQFEVFGNVSDKNPVLLPFFAEVVVETPKKKKKHRDEVMDEHVSQEDLVTQEVVTVDDRDGRKKKKKKLQHEMIEKNVSQEDLVTQEVVAVDDRYGRKKKKKKRHHEMMENDVTQKDLVTQEVVAVDDRYGRKKKKKKRQHEMMEKNVSQEDLVAQEVVAVDDRDGRKKKKKKRQHEMMEKNVTQEDLVAQELVAVDDRDGRKKKKKKRQHEMMENDVTQEDFVEHKTIAVSDVQKKKKKKGKFQDEVTHIMPRENPGVHPVVSVEGKERKLRKENERPRDDTHEDVCFSDHIVGGSDMGGHEMKTGNMLYHDVKTEVTSQGNLSCEPNTSQNDEEGRKVKKKKKKNHQDVVDRDISHWNLIGNDQEVRRRKKEGKKCQAEVMEDILQVQMKVASRSTLVEELTSSHGSGPRRKKRKHEERSDVMKMDTVSNVSFEEEPHDKMISMEVTVQKGMQEQDYAVIPSAKQSRRTEKYLKESHVTTDMSLVFPSAEVGAATTPPENTLPPSPTNILSPWFRFSRDSNGSFTQTNDSLSCQAIQQESENSSGVKPVTSHLFSETYLSGENKSRESSKRGEMENITLLLSSRWSQEDKEIHLRKRPDADRLVEETAPMQVCHLKNREERNITRKSLSYIDERHKCTRCHQKFSSVVTMMQHECVIMTKRKSKPDNPQASYVCEQCGRKYIQQCHMEHHVRATHLGLKPYICSVCSMAFSEKQTVIVHERLHSQSKPYSCVNCSKNFTTQSQLNRHYKTQHGYLAKFACSFCHLSYFSSRDLRVHVESRHRKKTANLVRELVFGPKLL